MSVPQSEENFGFALTRRKTSARGGQAARRG